MIDWKDYSIGGHRITCPACGRGGIDRTMGLTMNAAGSGVCHCFRCDFTESYRPEGSARLAVPPKPFVEAMPSPKSARLSAYGYKLWQACEPLADIALDYLTARRCRVPPANGDLRWHASLKHPSGYAGPCLVALITHAVTSEPLSLHRTWIRGDGRKADVEPPRLLLRGHRKQGGVIRLWPTESATAGLGITEGIETALSLAWAYEPVWACIDAGNLAALPVLPGVQSLVIGADNDPAGIAAAYTCARRWSDANVEVHVTRQPANDLNDVLMEAA
ncbi:DUF7146 domain-containing protein [Paraburkholderia caledonica]|uniref:Toprim domain-containing protein n=1 Tax=Paraburkholderia caledonica TaxID=134536 RepID=A0AB73I622_9BURK|nr:hypothetical protein [Paraburkholderia caledonica]